MERYWTKFGWCSSVQVSELHDATRVTNCRCCCLDFLVYRAIYFCTYSSMKSFCNETFKTPDTPPVHICSAAAAGFVSCTATNPIWLVKTRLQLDQRYYLLVLTSTASTELFLKQSIRFNHCLVMYKRCV